MAGLELSDVYEVALLKTLGHNEVKVEMRGGKVYFCFDDKSNQQLRDVLINDVQVSAKAYRHNIQDVRGIVFGMRRTQDGGKL